MNAEPTAAGHDLIHFPLPEDANPAGNIHKETGIARGRGSRAV